MDERFLGGHPGKAMTFAVGISVTLWRHLFLFFLYVSLFRIVFLFPPGAGQQQTELASEVENSSYSYEDLKVIDPIAANRIHPNNHRKVGFLHIN